MNFKENSKPLYHDKLTNLTVFCVSYVNHFFPILGRWVPAGETDGPVTSLDVDGLQPGHKYKFRVRAVNKQGKSEPLTTSQAIEAKNPFGKM
jgi:hypothetical protein